MPAIQPARLRQQAVLLVEHFNQPAAFVRSLHHLLDYYADRAHRPGQSGAPAPLLAAYNVRPPVLRQILQELAPLADEEPQAALDLADALWEKPYLEFRLLAASLLGFIRPAPAQPILDRAASWIRSDPQDRMIDAILGKGLSRLRQESLDSLIVQIEEWLGSEAMLDKKMGLRALIPVVNERHYENLPVFFRLIQPLTRAAPEPLRADLLALVKGLAHRSPRETAHLLRENLRIPFSPDAPWVLRQSLREFPPEIEESLRAAVRGIP